MDEHTTPVKAFAVRTPPPLRLAATLSFSSGEPPVNSVASPRRIRALVAQQERNQPGHLVRRAHPLHGQHGVVPGIGIRRAGFGPQIREHGCVDGSSWANADFSDPRTRPI